MAKFHHIVGAILKDIAHARITSDLHAREVSQAYQQDDLLRLFPVPRTEIRDVEIDLHFAITDLNLLEQEHKRRRQIQMSLDNYASALAVELQLLLKDGLNIPVERIDRAELKAYIHRPLLLKRGVYINPAGVYDQTKVAEIVGNALKDFIATLTLQPPLEESIRDTLVNNIVTLEINTTLQNLGIDVQKIYAQLAEHMLNIEVEEDKLVNLPINTLSSVKITSSIKNYVWTELEDEQGNKTRRLIPE